MTTSEDRHGDPVVRREAARKRADELRLQPVKSKQRVSRR
ncbi:hypothetical protein BCL50_2476 [Mycolicibacterium litorale]|nr:hypothetical protein BCL50_2476 [Mycolicibacterium litorale]